MAEPAGRELAERAGSAAGPRRSLWASLRGRRLSPGALPTGAILLAIFLLALVLRSSFAYSDAVNNGYLVSGGSDSYYWERIIDHNAQTGEQLYQDPDLNYPLGQRNPRPPLYSMTTTIAGYLLSPFFGSLEDGLGYALIFSTAVWGALTVLPTYYIGREMFGRRAGILAALLLAIMPGHLQRSVLTNADHDALILFWVVTSFYFLLRALKTVETTRWVGSWRSLSSIRSGLGSFVRQSEVSILYALLAGVSFGALIMAWVGFAYAQMIILGYFGVQLLVHRFRNVDSTSVWLILGIVFAVAFAMSYPVYRAQAIVDVRFDVPVYLFVGMMAVGAFFVVTRDYPWTVVLPTLAGLGGAAIGALFLFAPSLAEAILTGQGYLVRSKLYSTIAEVTAADFSTLGLSFGAITFYLAFAGVAYALYRIPKHQTADYIFIVVWTAVSLFLAVSSARFMFNAAPAFAITSAWIVILVVEWLDFPGVRRALRGASGGPWQIFKKSVKVRHILGALFLAFLIVLPNAWYSLDAAIPVESKRDYEREVYNALPELLRPNYDPTTRSWFFGAFGYSLPLPQYYYPAAWQWFSTQDASIQPQVARPAYLSWWDYGFESIQAGRHPAVADNFQNGYKFAGNALLAQGETELVALFAARLLQGELAHNGYALTPELSALLSAHGLSPQATLDVYVNSAAYIDEVLAHPDRYGKLSGDLSDENAMWTVLRVRFTELGHEEVVALYQALMEFTGHSIRYFAVDSRLFPTDQSTGIFYAPAKLSDKRVNDRNEPMDFFTVLVQDRFGNTYSPDRVPPEAEGTSLRLFYLDPFYESMFYRAYAGFSAQAIGKNDTARHALPGLGGQENPLSTDLPMPAWNLTHFKVVYRTVYLNPHPRSEVQAGLWGEEWRAVSYDEALAVAANPSYTVDLGAANLYSSAAIFIKYYHGAYLNGTVRTTEGLPAPGIQITVQDEYGIPHDATKTDAQGRYSVLLPFGNISVIASVGKADGKTKVGTEVARTTVEVTDAQAMRVREDLDHDGRYDYLLERGFVVGSGSVGGSLFWDPNHDGNYTAGTDPLLERGTVRLAAQDGEAAARLVSVAQGAYRFTGLPPGSYVANLELDGYTLPISDDITLKPGDSLTRDRAIAPGTISGQVSVDYASSPEGIRVVLEDLVGTYETELQLTSSGSFSFPPLLPSRYALRAEDALGTSFPFERTLQTNGSLYEELRVSLASDVRVEVRAGGVPVPFATLQVVGLSDRNRTGLLTADASGVLAVRLPRGWYSFSALHLSGSDRWVGATAVDASGPSATAQLDLLPSVLLQGSVRRPNSNLPASGARFEFLSSSTGGLYLSSATPAGLYKVELPAGSYSAFVLHGSGVSLQLLSVDGPATVDFMLTARETQRGLLYWDGDRDGIAEPTEGLRDGLVIATELSSGARRVVSTDRNGIFALSLAPELPVRLEVRAVGYAAQIVTVTPLPGTSALTSVPLAPIPVELRGRVSLDGLGLRGITVTATALSQTALNASVQSGVDGVFSLSLQPGEYRLEVFQYLTAENLSRVEGSVQVSAKLGQPQSGLELALTKRVRVFGTLSGFSGASSAVLRFSGPEQAELAVGADGAFSLFLERGLYTMWAEADASGGRTALLTELSVTDLSAPLSLELQPGVELRGQATISGSSLGFELAVSFRSESSGLSAQTMTAPAGDYSAILPEGAYVVSVDHVRTETDEGRARLFRYSASVSIVAVGPQLVVDLSLERSLALTALSGRVVGLGGDGVSATLLFHAAGSAEVSASATAGADGRYALQVEPGSYTVLVRREADRSVALLGLAVGGASQVQDFQLSAGFPVSLRVLRDGLAQPSASVSLVGRATLEFRTDSAGATSALLPGGQYTVTAQWSETRFGVEVAYGASASFTLDAVRELTLSLQRKATYAVDLSWDLQQRTAVLPGEQAIYWLEAANLGTAPDTLELSAAAEGFAVSFAPQNLTLDVGTAGKASVQVTVTALPTARVDHAPLTVEVRSRSLPSARDTVTLELDVLRTYGVAIAQAADRPAVEGRSTVLRLFVNNTGNAEDRLAVSLGNLAELAQGGWSAALQETNGSALALPLQLAAHSSRTVQVRLEAQSASPIVTVPVVVVASSLGAPQETAQGVFAIPLPNLGGANGDLTVSGPGVRLAADAVRLYTNLGLFIALIVLGVTVFLIARRKGAGKR